MSDDLWIKLMKLGAKLGCHQKADRSFFIKGCQYPVCARCMGMHIGYVIAVVSAFFFFSPISFCIILCGIMFLDWFIQFAGITESNNIRRLVTGIMGGYGVLTIEIKAILLLILLAEK